MERLMEKVVWMPKGQALRLAASMGVTKETVSRAMNGLATDLGRRLRYVACREFGGRVVEWDLPELCRQVGVMIHDHATGRRIVALGKGHYLVTYLLDNALMRKNVVRLENREGGVRQWDAEGLTVEGYMMIQDEVADYVAGL